MDSLPQELVDHISSYLGRNDLKNTLLLTTKFQRVAEQYSEAFSTYTISEDNNGDFVNFCRGRLVQHLRNIKFWPSLPALDMDTYKRNREAFEDNPCRDTIDELREMDEEFTRQIRSFFTMLHEVEQAGFLDGHRGLELEIHSPTRAVDESEFCLHRVFTSWRIHIISPETLPQIACIRSLVIRNGTDFEWHDVPDPPFRKPDLRMILDIAARLPNLQVLKCNVGGDEWMAALDLDDAMYTVQDWPGPRRDSRHNFAKATQVIQLPTLSHVNLDFIYPIYKADWVDQRLPMPNLVKPAMYDPFSSSLRLLSYQLRTMKLRVVTDETLFWPADGSTPSWPNLESLSVMFHAVSPSGAWYFEGPHDVGANEGVEIDDSSYPPLETTEEDEIADGSFDWEVDWDAHRVFAQYRVKPTNKTLVPFLTAFAKAAALMPSLREAALWAPLTFDPEHVEQYAGFDCKEVAHATNCELAWGLAYAKPGMRAFTEVVGENFAAFPQMWWYVGEWRPDPELLDLFHQIGRQEQDEPTSMHWGDRFTNPGLVERGEFEGWESWRFDH
ncbi:hypothetical protein C7974DRAFT_422975 [Boeremia exigua]|uniref:uncharacterized protein n=1 Tax=Boeremia exigua TaxID=749465 RepID=UPI001E8CAAA0|nr:uncharacterized protein C7974DRAFT_422975 [Boeremia exigua]KAH6638042.1 hypothetical protein C7974DRAFT_422975 [Boeremia exigua]